MDEVINELSWCLGGFGSLVSPPVLPARLNSHSCDGAAAWSQSCKGGSWRAPLLQLQGAVAQLAPNGEHWTTSRVAGFQDPEKATRNVSLYEQEDQTSDLLRDMLCYKFV